MENELQKNKQLFDLDIANLSGQIPIVSAVPSHIPRKFSEQFRIYVSGTTYRFYWYDPTNAAWRYSSSFPISESDITLSDNTTNDVTSTKHGFAPKSLADATKFLNGAATPAYALVKDSDLSTSDITTNDVSTAKHGFTPKAPNDTTKFLRGDGTWAVPSAGGFTIIQKSSDETISSDDTMTADSQLQFVMAANTAYSIKLNVGFNTSATADIKFELDGPASPTNVGYTGNRVSSSGSLAAFGGNAYNVAIAVTGTATAAGHIAFDIVIQNGANAGTFSLRWAQNTSDASNTTVLKGSTLEYKAIA